MFIPSSLPPFSPFACLARRTLAFFPRSTRLAENLALAERVNEFVLKKIPYVGTWGIQNPAVTSLSKLEDVLQTIHRQRQRLVELYDHQPAYKKNFFVLTEISAALAAKSGHGNCGEMTSLALFHLAAMGYRGRAAKYQLTRPSSPAFPLDFTNRGSHNFLILGLGPMTECTNTPLECYGKDAVVVDLYAKKSYPAAELPMQLENFYGFDEEHRPLLSPFNPAVDSIDMHVNTLFSAPEFLHLFPYQKYSPIAELLNDFHVVSGLEQDLILERLSKRISLTAAEIDQKIKALSEQPFHHEDRGSCNVLLSSQRTLNTLKLQVIKLQHPSLKLMEGFTD